MTKEQQQRVQEYILRGLSTGELAAGEKLPAERELAERLGTTRASVRQALDLLEAQQHVTRHVGRGTFVADDATLARTGVEEATSAEPRSEASVALDVRPAELIEARQLFEPHVTELVVLSASEADVQELRRIVEAQRGLPPGASFEESDIRFHEALARATRNALLVEMAQVVTRSRRAPEWQKLKNAVAARNGGVWVAAMDEHLAIVEAIEARDPGRAREAALRHLERVRMNLLGT